MMTITRAGMDELKQRLIGKPIIHEGVVVAHVTDVIPSDVETGKMHIAIQAINPDEQETIMNLMSEHKAFIDVYPGW